jgi:hypothetical protein
MNYYYYVKKFIFNKHTIYTVLEISIHSGVVSLKKQENIDYSVLTKQI